MKKLPWLFIPAALWIASCLPQNVDVPQSPLLRILERKSGLIAYVGADGNVFVSDQGGGSLMQLTEDAFFPESEAADFLLYQFPTWSRDGSKLAFSGLNRDGAQATSELFIADIDRDEVSSVYTSATEHPFFLYWSPDNSNLSFLSTAENDQILILQSIAAEGGARTVLDADSPYYWTWAPDGRIMLVHAGGTGSTPDRLAFLRVDGDVIEQALDWRPASFQTPAWSPDGGHIALAEADEEGNNSIVVTDAAGNNRETVGTFEINTAFAWSGDGAQLAFIAGEEQLSAGSIGPLHVFDLETSDDLVLEDSVMAFFWSPDGEEIAYFRPVLSGPPPEGDGGETTTTLLLDLNVLEVASGESRHLYTYQPTEQFIAVLPYFDQYHQSATIWSPDNNNLVLSFADDQGNPGIAVVAASGQLQPRVLAQGVLAFWSWK